MWENGIAAKIDKLKGIFGGVIIDKIESSFLNFSVNKSIEN